MKKRIMAFFMALCLLVSMVPMDTFAAAGDGSKAGGATLTEVSAPEAGKTYVIVASRDSNTCAMTTERDDVGYINEGSYKYIGLKGREFSTSMTVSEDMLWKFETATNGFYIKNGNDYLNGTYSSSGDNKGGNIWLDSATDVWTLSGSQLKSTKAGKTLQFGNDRNGFTNLFSVRSTGSDLKFYEYSVDDSGSGDENTGESGNTEGGTLSTTPASKPEAGKIYVIVGTRTVSNQTYTNAMTTEYDEEGYWNTQSKYNYTGMKGKAFSTTMTVTEDMLWSFVASGNGFHIKNGDRYLNGKYQSNNVGGSDGYVKLNSTQDVWTLANSNKQLKSTNAGKTLQFGNDGSNPYSNVFSVRSTGSDLTFYEYIPAESDCDHTWGDWATVTPATCTTNGSKERECSKCHETDTEVIEASHNYATTWSKDASGHWYECSVCHDKKDKAAHSFANQECSDCGYEKVVVEGTLSDNAVSTPESGKKYVIVANNSGSKFALTTLEGEGYENTGNYVYSGFAGQAFTLDMDVTEDILWDITASGNGFHIKNSGLYLGAEYSANNDSITFNGGKIFLDEEEDVWSFDIDKNKATRLKSANAGKFLKHGNSGTTPNVFSVRSDGTELLFYEFVEGLAHEHDTTLVPAKAATCEAAGNSAYYTCECGKWFEDKEATTEITDKSLVNIVALGHDMSAATCTEAAKCKRTGCNHTEGTSLGHAWSNDYSKNETKHWKECTRTGCTAKDSEADHTFRSNKCTECEYVRTVSAEGTIASTASTPVSGKQYVIVAETNSKKYALTTVRDDNGYTNSNGQYKYTGFVGADLSENIEDMEDIVWNITVTNGSLHIKKGDLYLSGTYTKYSNSGYAGNIVLGNTEDTWTIEDNKLKSTNASKNDNNNKKMYLTHSNAKESFVNLFSVRSSSNASEIKFYEYIPATNSCDHEWSAWTTVTEATCTAKGVEKRTCPACDAEETRETDKAEHTFAAEWSKDATNHWKACTNPLCTEKSAYDTHTYRNNVCTECGHDISHMHVLVVVPAKAATCEEPGNTQYYECSGCNVLFADNKATEVITDSTSVVVPATGHKMGSWTVTQAATCTAIGYEKSVCTNAGCDEYQIREISMKDHDWEAQPTIDVAATCYSEGSKSVHCKNCEATKNSEVIPMTAHNFGTYVSDNNATCTVDGTKTAKCTNAGCTVTDTVTETGTKGHKFGTKWIMDSEEHWNECTVCEGKGNRAAHTFKNDECTVCEFKRDHVHELELVPAVAATCETDGNTAYYVCEGCDTWFEDANAAKEITDKDSVVVGKTGHKFGEYVSDNNATCTEDGTKTAACTNTGCTKKDTVADTGSTLGHSFTKYVSDGNAGCEEDGTKTAKCDRCDKTNSITDEGSKTGHKYTIWHVVKEATCTEDGLQERECTVCEKEAEEVIPAKGHLWDEKATVDVEPTCTEKGSESIHCSACDETKDTKELDALGHSFTNYKTNGDATCTADGTLTAICNRCDKAHTKADEGSALGHRYAAAWSKGADAHWHECIECGDKKDVKEHEFKQDTCTICEYERNHVHQTVSVAAKEATCTEAGNTAYYSCKGCEDWFEDASGTKVIADKTKVVLAKLGHEKVAPTCTLPTTCSRCDYTEGNALGHEFKNYVSDNNAKCEKDGTKTAKCTRCSETDTLTDKGTATGHTYGNNKKCIDCNKKKPFAKVNFTEKSGSKTYTGKEITVSGDIVNVDAEAGAVTLRYYVDKACEIPTYDGLENAGAPAVKTGIYYVKAVVAETDEYDETISDDTYVLKIVPKRVTGFKAVNNASSIKLTWKKSSEASGYRIYRREYGTSSSDYKLIKTITSNSTLSYTDKDIEQGTHYYYTIAAYKKANDGEATVIGSRLKTAAQIIRVKVKSVVNNNGSVKITWSEVEKADSYEVWRKVSGKDEEYKRIKTITSGATSYTDKAAKMLVNGRLSSYYIVVKYDTKSDVVVKSNTKKNYYMKRASVSSISVKSTSATVKWSKNSSATGYEIMYSTSSSFANAKTVNISSKDTVSKKITGLKSGKKYYVKVRAYKMKDNVQYNSTWSASKSFKTSK